MDVRDYKSVWDQYKNDLMPRLLEIAIIIGAIFILQPPTWYYFGITLATIISLISFVKNHWLSSTNRPAFSVKSWVRSFIIGSVLWWMWYFLEGWTIIFGIIAIAAWRMWQQKELVKKTIDAGVELLEKK